MAPHCGCLAARNLEGVAAWGIGVLFIPTLALALGVWSGSSKLFEVIYTLLWYVGPANQLAALDYTGVSGGAGRSGAPVGFLCATLILAALALAGRKRQISL